jgi:periplasmic protein TonB
VKRAALAIEAIQAIPNGRRNGAVRAPAVIAVAPGMSPLLRWTLAASLGVHLVFLSLHFELPKLFKQSMSSPPLEVSLVNAKTLSKPSQADFLAQANLDGGGNTDAKRRLSSPLPRAAMDAQQTQLAAAREQVETLERQTRELLQQLNAKKQLPADREAKETSRADSANAFRELSAKALELQRLEAQISREFDSYQQRPKKKHVGARATEYRFARYVEDWRQKVERVGNANYPEVARTQKLYGSLVITVAIKADGRIEAIEVDRGSGKKILDAAAVKIVELAAPYAPFPADIRNDTDILYITRTWSFTRAGELESTAANVTNPPVAPTK